MLNIVLPIAGRGSRFSEAGYCQPKPLIPVFERPMIELVVANLRPSRDHRFIFLALRDHLEQSNLLDVINRIAPSSTIITVDSVTDGAACTVLLARDIIDNSEPLMIANTDQYVNVSIDDYLAAIDEFDCDGMIMTFPASDPKWSYVRKDANEQITSVVEKQVVSNEATVGIYNFKRGSDFVVGACTMIKQDFRVNGEFYVAPVYNWLIQRQMIIRSFPIEREGVDMFGLGTPDDLKSFLTMTNILERISL